MKIQSAGIKAKLQEVYLNNWSNKYNMGQST